MCLQDIAIRNLDYIFTVSAHAIASASPDILANLEKKLDLRSSEPWSYRRLPTPTATFPAIIDSEEEDSNSDLLRTRDNHSKKPASRKERDQRLECFLQPKEDPSQGTFKLVRALWKKLQQIEMLEAKQSNGQVLDNQQVAKLQTKSALEISLVELGVPFETIQAKASSSVVSDGKGNRKVEVSRKERRKSKQVVAQSEAVSVNCRTDLEANPVKGLLDPEIPQESEHKVRFQTSRTP